MFVAKETLFARRPDKIVAAIDARNICIFRIRHLRPSVLGDSFVRDRHNRLTPACFDEWYEENLYLIPKLTVILFESVIVRMS